MRCCFLTLFGFFVVEVLVLAEHFSISNVSEHPKNLARHHLGARVLDSGEGEVVYSYGRIDLNRCVDALLTDDVTIGVPVEGGGRSLMVELAEISTLSRFSFYSEGYSGRVSFFSSSSRIDMNSTEWERSGEFVVEEGGGFVSFDLPSVDARYVKLDFSVARPGRVKGLGIFGVHSALSYDFNEEMGGYDEEANMRISPGANLDLSMLSSTAGGRVVYLSSNGSNSDPNALIDGDSATRFHFDKNDKRPKVIIKLTKGSSFPLSRVSSLHSADSGVRMSVYVFDDEVSSFDDYLGAIDAVAVVEGTSSFAVAEMNDRRGVYVGIMWEKVGVSDFSVAEVAGFSSDYSPSSKGGVKVASVVYSGTDAVVPEETSAGYVPYVAPTYFGGRYMGGGFSIGRFDRSDNFTTAVECCEVAGPVNFYYETTIQVCSPFTSEDLRLLGVDD